MGMQDSWQHWPVGQLHAAGHHRHHRVDQAMDDVVQKVRECQARFMPATLGEIPCVLIADFRWWVRNESEIEPWMDAYLQDGSDARNGMIVEFADQEEMMLFLLTWQGSRLK
jgi:hypothetical protein